MSPESKPVKAHASKNRCDFVFKILLTKVTADCTVTQVAARSCYLSLVNDSPKRDQDEGPGESREIRIPPSRVGQTPKAEPSQGSVSDCHRQVALNVAFAAGCLSFALASPHPACHPALCP